MLQHRLCDLLMMSCAAWTSSSIATRTPRPRDVGSACDCHGIVNVQRTIGAHGCGRPHRSGHHNGLVAFHNKVQKIRCFFQRVRPVRNGNAIHIRRSQNLIHPFGKLDPDFIVHVLASDAGDLFAFDVGYFFELGNGLDQDVHANSTRLIARIGCRCG